jgi:hypothetical protein
MSASPKLRDMLATCRGQVIVLPTTEEQVIRVKAAQRSQSGITGLQS